MPRWDNAPVTKAALWDSPGEHGPSALEREWSGQLKHAGDFILLIAGCYRRAECSPTNPSWTALWWNVSEGAEDPSLQRGAAASAAAANVERLLTPFCREVRVRLMQELYSGARSSDDLAGTVGLKGGALFSHLGELVEAGLVEKQSEGVYALTNLGCNLLLILTSLAGVSVKDMGTEGLVIGGLG